MSGPKTKICSVCGETFKLASGGQLRCPSCIKQGLVPGPRPLCLCGCRQPVKSKDGKWCKYILGHMRRTLQCPQCGKEFTTGDNRRKHCSRKCANENYKGENNPLWRGGLRVKYESVTINGRTLRKHRAVMEAKIGRRLEKNEVVHHIDGDGLNNDPDNLWLFHCDSYHKHYHFTRVSLQYKYPHSWAGEPKRTPRLAPPQKSSTFPSQIE